MSTPRKSTSAPKAAADKFEIPQTGLPDAFATLFTKGVERAVAISKTSLDLAASQNAEIIQTCKMMAAMAPTLPGASIFDLAAQAFTNYVEMEKSVLDLMLQQNTAMVDTVKTSGISASEISDKLTAAMSESADFAVAVHKTILDFAAKQNKAIGETVGKQPGIAGTALAAAAESIQRSMNAVIEAQKQVAEFAAKPLKAQSAKARS